MIASIVALVAAILWILVLRSVKTRSAERAHPILFQMEFERAYPNALHKRDKKTREQLERDLTAWMKKYSKAPRIYFELSDLYTSTNRTEEADKCLKRFSTQIKSNRELEAGDISGYFIRKILIELDKKNYSAAEKLILDYSKKYSADPKLYLLYAKIAEMSGNTNLFFERMRFYADSFIENADVASEAAITLYNHNAHSEGDSLLERAQARFPNAISVYIPHARSLHDQGTLEEAALRWGMIRELFPLNPEAYEKGADALELLGRSDEASLVRLNHPGEKAVSWPKS